MSERVVGAFEAKTHLSALLERVAQGEEIVITRHGRPIARLLPAVRPTPHAAAAAERLLEIGRSQQLGFDWQGLRDEGRH